MYIDFKKVFFVIILLLIGAGIGIAGTKLIQRYQAPKQTVSVVGAGEVDAVTDQVTISIQIKTDSITYEKAQEENKKDVEKLKSDLTKLGIPESRITISSYSQPIFRTSPSVDLMMAPEGKIMPDYRPPDTTPSITTSLTLVIDPIKNIEKVFEVISKNSNAQITNTYYSLKNRKTWETKAKENALKDALTQVESIAKINRLKVGKLLTIEDDSSPKPYPMALKAINNINESAPQEKESDIYYGEQTVKITSSYTATYELY